MMVQLWLLSQEWRRSDYIRPEVFVRADWTKLHEVTTLSQSRLSLPGADR